jgi:transposase InsO family protein
MGHETDRTRSILPKLSKGNYNTLVKLISNSLTFSVSDAAKFRLHVLDHYYKHGIRSACHAFGVPRSTIFGWRKMFEKSGKKISSLIPVSTRPINVRQMDLNSKLLEFIRAMREKYGSLSKYKIKPFLDEYARENSLPLYGTTKIGVIIKRKKYFFETKSKRKIKRRKPLTPRLKYAPKETIPGYIEMDSIIIYVLGRKYCFITAIDIVTKFAWVKLTTNLSSRQAKLALIQFESLYDHLLRVIQTDNGSEFLGEFDKHLSEIGIRHEFTYQKSPKVNGVVERFNRTIQEEFIERNDEILYDKQRFNQKLTNYLIWYNTKRPHYSLGQISPTEYMQKFK